MEATSPLRQDHALLRKKLTLLETALQVAPEARLVLREMCFSLQRMLDEHIRRERALFQTCEQHLPPGHEWPRMGGHLTERTLLRSINELLLHGLKASVPLIVPRLRRMIDELQGEMEEQEHRVFPVVDEILQHATPAPPAPMIIGSMSANEILQRYPTTAPVFNQLHINRLREGYESVDELAWRHGVESSEVLEALRQTVHV